MKPSRIVPRVIVAHAAAATAIGVPWPALMAQTWQQTDNPLLLGVAGAARMLPYVVLSWLVGSIGDRYPRLRVVKLSTWLRVPFLIGAAVAFTHNDIPAALILTTIAICIATPAYPALAASFSELSPLQALRATRWLVTVEVSAFVVGPAIGGLVLAAAGSASTYLATIGLATVGALMLIGVPVQHHRHTGEPYLNHLREVLTDRCAQQNLLAVAVVNAIIASLGVTLIWFASTYWGGGERAFGILTAALGFGSLAAPGFVVYRKARGVRFWLVVFAVPVLLLAPVTDWAWSVAPLVLIGAVATQTECAVTTSIQQNLPTGRQACALGVADTVMVTAALAASAVAPTLAIWLGPRWFITALAGLGLLSAWAVGRSRAPLPSALSAPDHESAA